MWRGCMRKYTELLLRKNILKKYDTAYTGVSYTGFIAYNTNKLAVAYYGVIPCYLHYKGKMILAAQSADTMTHPGYRYKGMFVELSKITFDLCRASGIRIIFGFPNQNSYHGAIHKLGWQMTETMECFQIQAGGLPVEAFSKRFLFTEKLYKQYSQSVLKNLLVPENGVVNSVISEGFAGLLRNEEYFINKKYGQTQVIKSGTVKCWFKINNGLIIGDMEGVYKNNFTQVMYKLKKLALKLGVRQILFQSSPGTHLHSLFATCYKAIPSFPVLFQDFGVGIPLDKIKFTFADVDIF